MNRTKKVISLMLTLMLCFSVLTLASCESENTNSSEATSENSSQEEKELTPAERLNAVVDNYNAQLESTSLIKLFTQLPNGGSVDITVEDDGTSLDEPVGDNTITKKCNFKIYLDKDKISAKLDFESGENKLNLTAGVEGTKVLIATDALDTVYGIDLAQVKDKFPTSIFGTKGSNIFGFTDEEEKEFIDAIEEIAEALKQANTSVDTDTKTLVDILTAHITLTEDKETPYLVNGESLSNVTLNATMTKEGFIKFLEDIIKESKTEEDIKKLLEIYNEESDTQYATIADMINNELSDYEASDVILSFKIVLNEEKNLPYAIEFKIGKTNSMLVEFGKDVENPTEIKITVDEDGTVSKGTIKIENTIDKYTLTFTDDTNNEGLVIMFNKLAKKVTLTPIEEGTEQTDEALTFDFELTADSMKLSAEDEGMKITVILTAKDASPITFDEYKDVLTLTEDELMALSEQLATLFPAPDIDEPDIESEFDEIYTSIDIEEVE